MTTPRWTSLAVTTASLLLAACASNDTITAPATSITNARAGFSLGNQCATTVLRVNAAAKPGGDGSLQHPFADLPAALAEAEKAPCGVRIALAAGTYPASADPQNQQQSGVLTIDRGLSIVGEGQPVIKGGLVITAGAAVSFAGLTIADAPGAALTLKNEKAALTLVGVALVRSSGYGMVINGGTTTLTGVEISNTLAIGTDQSTGTALLITGGAHVDMALALLHDNAHALYAAGAGTAVNAMGLVVRNTGPHPALAAALGASGCSGLGYEHVGAVEFADGAVGTGIGWAIEHSAMAGLYAHDGASVTVTSIGVDDVTYVRGTGPHTEICGGFDVVSQRGGEIALTLLNLSNAAVCGAVVGPEPGSGVDLHHGQVADAPIGACVQQDGYAIARLSDHVNFVDVDIALQATSYSLPSGPPP